MSSRFPREKKTIERDSEARSAQGKERNYERKGERNIRFNREEQS